MSNTRRSTYRKSTESDGAQGRLDRWFVQRQQKQARLDAEATERSMRSRNGGYSFA